MKCRKPCKVGNLEFDRKGKGREGEEGCGWMKRRGLLGTYLYRGKTLVVEADDVVARDSRGKGKCPL